ncbi:MAG: FadR family transcriptional regulator [Verrucomicrobia bacterium]|nr:MAG: FadR family transcriptional regulator [Verrucomicrobiota bacterium]TAE87165.1 MAG: FadR family transcriptional regulator [Verrucomicrobiota bacterium]TAF24969.1 MAG: FadR family transcriptional regulator [Verrucomicrobiota bacterium]TAF40704.1 MAG: FadR family transcriptional regulator [Verrucomicrobiota bacterium]
MLRRSAQIAGELEQEILAGKLAPGERLPSEEKFRERFKASRTVIREAIQQLRGRGLLRTQKGSGTYICDPSLESLGSAVESYSALAEEGDFLELIDFRILIETECARLAAKNAGEQVIRELSRILETMDRVRESREKFSKADIAFHLAIARGSGNAIYAILLAALEKRCIAYAQTNRGDGDLANPVIAGHREILDAIEAGLPDKAAESMRRHLLSSRRHFVDLAG